MSEMTHHLNASYPLNIIIAFNEVKNKLLFFLEAIPSMTPRPISGGLS